MWTPTGASFESLQKELAAAQAQGEAYARELAAVFRISESSTGTPSSVAPSSRSSRAPASSGDGLAVLVAAVRALGADLRGILAAIGRDIVPLRDLPGEPGEIAASVARHVTGASQVVADLTRLGTCPVGELPRLVDLAELVRDVVANERARAARRGVELVFRGPGDAEAVVETGAMTAPGASSPRLRHRSLACGCHGGRGSDGRSVGIRPNVPTRGAAHRPASAQGNVLSRILDAIASAVPRVSP